MHSIMFRCILYCFLLFPFCLIAQTNVPPLEREVTLKVLNESAGNVLTEISNQTNIKFSYNPSTVPINKRVSFSVTRKPVRTLLNLMFGESVQFKQKGNYIILTARSTSQEPAKVVTVSGYVYNDNGEKLTSASILNKGEQTAAVTNKYGYFKMEVPADKFPVKLKVEKENYVDTTMHISMDTPNVDVVLTSPPPELDTIPAQQAIHDTTQANINKTDTVKPANKKNFTEHFLLSEETKANIRNLKDTLFSSVQVSFIPYISTNKLLVGNTVNDVSLNILVGYSKGVKKAEVGGLMNIDREDVQYAQVAGLMNVVGGNVKGAQVAGWANLNTGRCKGFRGAGIFNAGHHMDGMQLAGIANINANYLSGVKKLKDFALDTVKGAQAAGIINVNAGYAEGFRLAGICNAGKDLKGAQLAGIINANAGYLSGVQGAGIINVTIDTARGVEVAGITNLNVKRVKGAQVAGLLNVTTDSVTGAQVAGLMNVAIRKVTGAQVAGLVNTSVSDITGTQVAGILNYTKKITGTQVALINIADSCNGVSIGLFNFVNQGYHKIELFGDEVIYTQMAFRTGTQHFHNIFIAGVDLTRKIDGLWDFGYGLGSTFNLNDKWQLTTDATAQMLLVKDKIDQGSQLASLYFGVERKFSNRFSMAFGPAYRVMITEDAETTGSLIADHVVPYTFYDKTSSNGTNVKMWIGAKLSFKFL